MANDLLLQSVEEGYWSTVTLMLDPWLEPLRATATFTRIREIVNAREAQSRAAFVNAGGNEFFQQNYLRARVGGEKRSLLT